MTTEQTDKNDKRIYYGSIGHGGDGTVQPQTPIENPLNANGMTPAQAKTGRREQQAPIFNAPSVDGPQS